MPGLWMQIHRKDATELGSYPMEGEMAVGSIGSTPFDPQAMASQMAVRIMKEADTDGNGTLSKAELQAFKDSKGGRGPDVDQVFATYAKSSSGELTQSELQSSIEAEGAKMKAKGGTPPAGGGAAPADGSAKADSTSSSSSSTTSTDRRDLNKDGTVTEAEILAYAISHPELQKQTSAGVAAWNQVGSPSTSSVDLYS